MTAKKGIGEQAANPFSKKSNGKKSSSKSSKKASKKK